MQGVIIKGIAGFYYVKTKDTVFQCKARGVFKKDGVIPLVGDMVEIETSDRGSAVINAIGKRENEFKRPQIANVDCFVVVIAASKPEPNFSVIDRFLVTAENNGAKAVICVNKIDIAEKSKIQNIKKIYENVYPIVCVSALSGYGVDELIKLMRNGKYALAGPSGVGKSTLLNAIKPEASAEIGEISRKTSRGKHTTRHAEIFEIASGALIYDTPGFTSFDVIDIDSDELQHLYPEIAALYGKCKFRNCMHIKEAGCAVIPAVTAGEMHGLRYASYKEIFEEITANREF